MFSFAMSFKKFIIYVYLASLDHKLPEEKLYAL